MKININNKRKCDDELLTKNYDLLYKFNLIYLIGHISILTNFVSIKCLPMVIYNIFSIAWFAYNAYKMSKNSIENYDVAEKRMMLEIITHQVLAFYFVGGSCGFQYILLANACSIFTLYKNSNGKKFYILKAVLMMALFAVLQFSNSFYVPKVIVPTHLAVLWTVLNVMYSFVASAYFTLKSYSNIIESLNNFKTALKEKNKKIQNIQRSMVMALSSIIETRDEETGEHINRTSYYVEKLINEMKKYPQYKPLLTDEFITNIKYAAPMHDIGKIKISDAILLKPSKLTDEEFEEMKKHTIYGGDIIKRTLKEIEDTNYVNMAYNIAVHHHEKWNGSGYPSGLKENDIPLEARIMALADVYDALTSERCYKKAFTSQEAYKIIKKDLGTHFDPQIGEIFLNILEKEEDIKKED